MTDIAGVARVRRKITEKLMKHWERQKTKASKDRQLNNQLQKLVQELAEEEAE